MTNDIVISIIIVNWRSTECLRPCLESINRNVVELRFEIIVIDNGSFDGSRELVEEQFPGVLFIQSETNLGYAAANNLAVAHSSGRYLLFLNPDTEVLDSPFGVLVSHLENHPLVGMVGSRVLNSDHSIQNYYLHSFPTLLNQILDIDVLKNTFPRWKLFGPRAVYCHQEPVCVDAISGSCILVRASAFERVGGFSESYFMYAEDLDLGFKMKKAGYRIQYLARGTVVHHGGKSSALHDRMNFAEVMRVHSIAVFFRNTKGAFHARVYRVLMACSALIRIIIVILIGVFGGVIYRKRWVLATWRKWTLILHWSISCRNDTSLRNRHWGPPDGVARDRARRR